MEPKPILVIAGNHGQYEYWMQDNHFCRRTAKYVTRPEQIQGYHDCQYVLTGEYWLNPLGDNMDHTEALMVAHNITKWKRPE